MKKTPQQARLDYARNEVELARRQIQINPSNQIQKDRLAYWSLELGDLETAQQYGTSPKLLGMIEEWIRTH